MAIQAKHKRKYPPLRIGDKVKMHRQRGRLEKEDKGDFKYDPTVIESIERSLGQTFYKVQGATKPYLRSDILPTKENEEGEPARRAETTEPAEPYVFYRRKRILQRSENKRLREQRAKGKA